MRRAALALAVTMVGTACAGDPAEPFDFDRVAVVDAELEGATVRVDYGVEPPGRSAVVRVGRIDGDDVTAAGVFVHPGEGAATRYFPPSDGDVGGPAIEISERIGVYDVSELDPGRYLLCTTVGDGDWCAEVVIPDESG